jgi:hypothetical protein
MNDHAVFQALWGGTININWNLLRGDTRELWIFSALCRSTRTILVALQFDTAGCVFQISKMQATDFGY